MNKETLIVPKGIRFLKFWEDFRLFNFPYILDKQITGCGFTEYCLDNISGNVVLCSPRKILLENKEKQHRDTVLYAKNVAEPTLNREKNANSDGKPEDNIIYPNYTEEETKKIIYNLKRQVSDYYTYCVNNHIPCKILVTYDSFRHVREALIDQNGVEHIEEFHIVIDEFQSIFTDSRFKSSTEIEFLSQLYNLQNICFASATPFMEEYLDMLPEFKDLPYYELDWRTEEPMRLTRPFIDPIACRNIVEPATDIIKSYLDGKFEKVISQGSDGHFVTIESREAILYMNSVKNICDIIKKSGLTLDNTNIICSNTEENKKKLLKAFGLSKDYSDKVIGEVPIEGETNKMFTLCTRTVYLGADFYSTNARTFIFSDANIDSLAIDITLDLPQIMGRQRTKENPWKNTAILYFKSLSNKKKRTQEEYDECVERKKTGTIGVLNDFSSATGKYRDYLIEVHTRDIKAFNYRDDYIAINTHSGSLPELVFNNLVMVSEMRAFKIQQLDYCNRFSTFNEISDSYETPSYDIFDAACRISDHINNVDNSFIDKMKTLCLASENFPGPVITMILGQIPVYLKNYWKALGPERIKACGYQKSRLDRELDDKVLSSNSLFDSIYDSFIVGNKYTLSEIKDKLKSIYDSLGYSKTAKATDLQDYFELKQCKLVDSSGKRKDGFEIVKNKIL